MQYDIVQNEKLTEVVKGVRKLLKEGWVPLGSIQSNGKTWVQAMKRSKSAAAKFEAQK